MTGRDLSVVVVATFHELAANHHRLHRQGSALCPKTLARGRLATGIQQMGQGTKLPSRLLPYHHFNIDTCGDGATDVDSCC